LTLCLQQKTIPKSQIQDHLILASTVEKLGANTVTWKDAPQASELSCSQVSGSM